MPKFFVRLTQDISRVASVVIDARDERDAGEQAVEQWNALDWKDDGYLSDAEVYKIEELNDDDPRTKPARKKRKPKMPSAEAIHRALMNITQVMDELEKEINGTSPDGLPGRVAMGDDYDRLHFLVSEELKRLRLG